MCSPVSSHRPQNLQPGELTFPILTLDGTEMGISGNCTPTPPGYTENTRSGSIAFPNLLHFFLGTSTDGTYIRIYLPLPTYINLHTSAVFQTLPYVCSTYLASMYIKHHTTSLARILSSKEKYTQVAWTPTIAHYPCWAPTAFTSYNYGLLCSSSLCHFIYHLILSGKRVMTKTKKKSRTGKMMRAIFWDGNINLFCY